MIGVSKAYSSFQCKSLSYNYSPLTSVMELSKRVNPRSSQIQSSEDAGEMFHESWAYT